MVVMFVDKIMSACCGDSELMNVMKMKLPWNKNHKTDDEPAHTTSKPINLMKKKTGKFTDKETKHELLKWKNLPLKARRAAEDLGYDASTWDNATELSIVYKHWHDLTEKELKAVTTLGWEEAAWEHRYEHNNWADLPDLQKKAASASGFSQSKWDDNEWPENLHKAWDDLTDADKEAMSVLGWTKRTWD